VKLALALLLGAGLAAQDKPADAPPKNGSIGGTVTAGSGGPPMKGVEVYVRRNSAQEKMAITDERGRYELRDVAPGQVRVSANAPDSSGRTGFGPSAARQVTLLPGQELSSVDFRMLIHGQIAGKVVDQNKEPVVGATVYLVTREYSYGALRAVFAGAAITNDQGEYLLQRVLPGRAYAVMAARFKRELSAISDSPLEPALRLPSVVPTFYPNARSIEGAEAIVLRPGERRDSIDVRLTRSAAFCLEGVLEGSGGPGALRYNITETQPHSGRSGDGGVWVVTPGGTSGPDGRVRICDLHPGDYELSVSEQNRQGKNGWAQFGAAIVTIGDRDVAGVRVGLRPRVPVSGEVVFDGPAPDSPSPGKLRIDVQSITRTEYGGVQAPMPGGFKFEDGLLMDDYGFEIREVPGLYVKDVAYGDRSILYRTLRPGSAMGNAGLRITLGRDGGSVSARVADKDGNAVADCNVVILPPESDGEAALAGAMKRGSTNQVGEWQSPTLPPGKYFVLATNDMIDKSPEVIGKLWKARNRGAEIEITAGGKASVKLAPQSLN